MTFARCTRADGHAGAFFKPPRNIFCAAGKARFRRQFSMFDFEKYFEFEDE